MMINFHPSSLWNHCSKQSSPPFHHATHAAHHVGQHIGIASYAHLPCRRAELQRAAPTPTRGVASKSCDNQRRNRNLSGDEHGHLFTKNEVWIVQPHFTNNDCTLHFKEFWFTFCIYKYKSPHFYSNPFLFSILNHIHPRTSSDPPNFWVLPTLYGIAQKNNVAAQVLQTHLLEGDSPTPKRKQNPPRMGLTHPPKNLWKPCHLIITPLFFVEEVFRVESAQLYFSNP